MKLILAQYLQMLKERDEFDKLLPDLLLVMGYVPISRPQTGVRQYGVDVAAVGISPEDGIQELLLFVIKCGDIGRNDWDSGPQSVRQSLNEVFDVYLKTHIAPDHESLRKGIVLATTGSLKQDVQINWDSYAKDHEAIASLMFWSRDLIAVLIEKYMLNEHVFSTEDRTDIRKSLALAGEPEYDYKDLYRLFLRQLGLTSNGEIVLPSMRHRDLVKALRIVNLSTQIFSQWSEEDGNLKQAVIASERALLWSWHRIQLEPEDERKKYYDEFGELWMSYTKVAQRLFHKLQPHYYVKNGLSGYCRENAEFSLVVFEQIGLIASIGLGQILVTSNDETRKAELDNASAIADALAALLKNNPVSGSPRLDIHTVDIVLGLMLLILTGYVADAQRWIADLIKRIDYTLKIKRNFPVCTDSTDDLVELTVFGETELCSRLMKMSWLLPTLASWAIILDRHDLYDVLARNSKTDYPEICLQLWHPTVEDLRKCQYFGTAHYVCGDSEAPIILADTANEYRDRLLAFLRSEQYNILKSSTAGNAGIQVLDLLACRHFRTPVAPFYWYQFLRNIESNLPPTVPETP